MVTPEEEDFKRRIERSLDTVKAWDSDEELLRKCRDKIPWGKLRQELDGDIVPGIVSLEHAFLKRLAKHFQTQVMTWVNQPPCSVCKTMEHMESRSTRPPETDEELMGKASRVEVYECTKCGQTTPFPRYNSTKKLIETCSGRCGEYANLFGLYCRAAGFETRYILDWTDHVWTEVRLGGGGGDRWVMVDSCEGVTDEFSMYEAGWGKNLSYIVALHPTHVMDVTPKYTRKFRTDDFQARRRSITTSEAAGDEILERINATLLKNLKEKDRESIKLAIAREKALLSRESSIRDWARKYENGRTSGSLEWRSLRHETGNTSSKAASETSLAPLQYSYRHAAFYPFRDKLKFHVRPGCSPDSILVNGSPCAVGIPDTISAVVVDDKFLGCILQSCCFDALPNLVYFLSTIPTGQIVLLAGKLAKVESTDTTKLVSALPGLKSDVDPTESFCFIGQQGYKPNWTCYVSETERKIGSRGVTLEALSSSRKESCSLRTVRGCHAGNVIGRLPERCMPLQSQKLATYTQKRAAVEAFLRTTGCAFGYTTKEGAPVYLLGSSSYPLSRDESSYNMVDGSWNSFLVLPKDLVPSNDSGISDPTEKKAPLYEVPLETEFFTRSLGPTLLRESSTVETSQGLRNARLVGLYFSAHWCGREYPCSICSCILILLSVKLVVASLRC